MEIIKHTKSIFLKTKKVLVLTLFISILISCDKFYKYDFIIRNEAKNKILITFSDYDNGGSHELIINPNSEETIYIGMGGKCEKTFGKHNCPPEPLDSIGDLIYNLHITMNDSIIVKTNFLNTNLWNYSEQDGLATYRTTVEDSDF